MEWTKITSNKVILDIVKGYHIDCISVPFQDHPPKQATLDKHEEIVLNALLTKLIQKGDKLLKDVLMKMGSLSPQFFCALRRMGNID